MIDDNDIWCGIFFVFAAVGGTADFVSFFVEAEAAADDFFDADVFSAYASAAARAAAAAAALDPGAADAVDRAVDPGYCTAEYGGIIRPVGGRGQGGRGGAG